MLVSRRAEASGASALWTWLRRSDEDCEDCSLRRFDRLKKSACRIMRRRRSQHPRDVDTRRANFLLLHVLMRSQFVEHAASLAEAMHAADALPRRLSWTGAHHTLTYAELSRRLPQDASSHAEFVAQLASIADEALENSLDESSNAFQQRSLATSRAETTGNRGNRKRGRELLDSITENKKTNKHQRFPEHDGDSGDAYRSTSMARRFRRHYSIHRLMHMLSAQEFVCHAGSSPMAAIAPAALYKTYSLAKRLRGHHLPVYCCLFNRSSEYMVSGSDDHMLKVWNARTGFLERTLRGHDGDIIDALLYHPKDILISAANDSTVRLWNLSTGAPVAVLNSRWTRDVNVIALCPCPNRPYLVTAGHHGSVRLWNVEAPTGDPVIVSIPVERQADSKPKNSGSSRAASVPDLSINTTQSVDPSIGFVATGTPTLAAASSPPQTQWQDSGLQDTRHAPRPLTIDHETTTRRNPTRVTNDTYFTNNVSAIDTQNSFRVETSPRSPAHSSVVASFAASVSPTPHNVSVATEHATLAESSIERTGSQSQVGDATDVVVHGGNISMGVSSSGIANSVVSASPSVEVLCVAFNPGGTRFAVSGTDNAAHLYAVEPYLAAQCSEKYESLPNVRFLTSFRGHADHVYLASFCHEGDSIATGSRDGTARIWRRTQVKLSAKRTREKADSAAGKWTCLVLDLRRAGQNVAQSQQRSQSNGSFMQSTGLGPNTTTSTPARARRPPWPASVDAIIWSLDDKKLVTSSSDNRIRVWDADNGDLLHTLEGHGNVVYVLCAHPFDSRIILSGGYDMKCFLWDIEKGSAVKEFRHLCQTQDAQPGGQPDGQPDGQPGAQADGQPDGQEQHLDAGQSARVEQSSSAGPHILDGQFAPDGTSFLVSDTSGNISLFSLKAGSVLDEAPEEQFFSNEYVPIRRDEFMNAVDEASRLPLHLTPRANLCSANLQPYPSHVQSLSSTRTSQSGGIRPALCDVSTGLVRGAMQSNVAKDGDMSSAQWNPKHAQNQQECQVYGSVVEPFIPVRKLALRAEEFRRRERFQDRKLLRRARAAAREAAKAKMKSEIYDDLVQCAGIDNFVVPDSEVDDYGNNCVLEKGFFPPYEGVYTGSDDHGSIANRVRSLKRSRRPKQNSGYLRRKNRRVDVSSVFNSASEFSISSSDNLSSSGFSSDERTDDSSDLCGKREEKKRRSMQRHAVRPRRVVVSSSSEESGDDSRLIGCFQSTASAHRVTDDSFRPYPKSDDAPLQDQAGSSSGKRETNLCLENGPGSSQTAAQSSRVLLRNTIWDEPTREILTQEVDSLSRHVRGMSSGQVYAAELQSGSLTRNKVGKACSLDKRSDKAFDGDCDRQASKGQIARSVSDRRCYAALYQDKESQDQFRCTEENEQTGQDVLGSDKSLKKREASSSTASLVVRSHIKPEVSSAAKEGMLANNCNRLTDHVRYHGYHPRQVATVDVRARNTTSSATHSRLGHTRENFSGRRRVQNTDANHAWSPTAAQHRASSEELSRADGCGQISSKQKYAEKLPSTAHLTPRGSTYCDDLNQDFPGNVQNNANQTGQNPDTFPVVLDRGRNLQTFHETEQEGQKSRKSHPAHATNIQTVKDYTNGMREAEFSAEGQRGVSRRANVFEKRQLGSSNNNLLSVPTAPAPILATRLGMKNSFPLSASNWLRTICNRFSYVPQVNDEVTYFPQGHRKAIIFSRRVGVEPLLRPSDPQGRLRRLLDGSHGTPASDCPSTFKIVAVEYQFPAKYSNLDLTTSVRNRLKHKANRHDSDLRTITAMKVAAILQLRPTDGDPSRKSRGTTGDNDVSLTYFPVDDLPEYLVLSTRVRAAVKQTWKPGDRFRILFLNECRTWQYYSGKVRSVRGNVTVSPWNAIEVEYDNEGDPEEGNIDFVSPWEMECTIDECTSHETASNGIPRPSPNPEIGYLNDVAKYVDTARVSDPEFGNHLSWFFDPVESLATVPLYCDVVPCPMDLGIVLSRLRTGFYRSCDGFVQDMALIRSNAFLFNAPESEICRAATIVHARIMDFAERTRASYHGPQYSGSGTASAHALGGAPQVRYTQPEVLGSSAFSGSRRHFTGQADRPVRNMSTETTSVPFLSTASVIPATVAISHEVSNLRSTSNSNRHQRKTPTAYNGGTFQPLYVDQQQVRENASCSPTEPVTREPLYGLRALNTSSFPPEQQACDALACYPQQEGCSAAYNPHHPSENAALPVETSPPTCPTVLHPMHQTWNNYSPGYAFHNTQQGSLPSRRHVWSQCGTGKQRDDNDSAYSGLNNDPLTCPGRHDVNRLSCVDASSGIHAGTDRSYVVSSTKAEDCSPAVAFSVCRFWSQASHEESRNHTCDTRPTNASTVQPCQYQYVVSSDRRDYMKANLGHDAPANMQQTLDGEQAMAVSETAGPVHSADLSSEDVNRYVSETDNGDYVAGVSTTQSFACSTEVAREHALQASTSESRLRDRRLSGASSIVLQSLSRDAVATESPPPCELVQTSVAQSDLHSSVAPCENSNISMAAAESTISYRVAKIENANETLNGATHVRQI